MTTFKVVCTGCWGAFNDDPKFFDANYSILRVDDGVETEVQSFGCINVEVDVLPIDGEFETLQEARAACAGHII